MKFLGIHLCSIVGYLVDSYDTFVTLITVNQYVATSLWFKLSNYFKIDKRTQYHQKQQKNWFAVFQRGRKENYDVEYSEHSKIKKKREIIYKLPKSDVRRKRWHHEDIKEHIGLILHNLLPLGKVCSKCMLLDHLASNIDNFDHLQM